MAGTARAKGDVSVLEPTREEQALARRVAESRATIPDLWVAEDVAVAAPPGTAALACAFGRALAAHPRANGAWRDGRIETYTRVNVGVVVPTDRGLVAPTLPDADTRAVPDAEDLLDRLKAAARDGSLAAPDQAGATATLWDLGTAGVARGGALVVPGQAVALAAGAVRDGRLALTLAFDHRVLDPWSAGALLRAIDVSH